MERLVSCKAKFLIYINRLFGQFAATVMRPDMAALDAKQAVIVTVESRGFTPAGELRHPVIRAWQAG